MGAILNIESLAPQMRTAGLFLQKARVPCISDSCKKHRFPYWYNVKYVELSLWKRHADLLITVTYKVDNLNNTGIAVTEFGPRPAS